MTAPDRSLSSRALKCSLRAMCALSLTLATAPLAQAFDFGLPGDAAASEILQVAAGDATIDLSPVGSATARASIEPELPPDAPATENGALPVADRMPFAIDALIARKTRPAVLGDGDWRAAREAVRALYVLRQFKPVWIENGRLNASGRSLLARLRHAADDALSLQGLDLPTAETDIPPEREIDAELALSTAAAVYALEASGARIQPQSITPLMTPKVPVADPAQALIDLAISIDPGETLRAFNPSHPGYRNLRDKLAELHDEAPIARLGRPTRGPRYAALVPPMPIVAEKPQTGLRALIEANMEMWRWEPRELGANRVEINIPEFALRLYQNDQVADEMRVIVGKPDTPTPVFSNQIRYLLINPIWRVPESIVKKEMLPKAGGNPSALEAKGFKVKYVGGQLFVEQPAGEGNALGHLLFMFPNEHAVYLHDTPSHGLFSTSVRAYSHGCIRVEAPLRLASEVMGRGWSEAKVQGMFGDTEHWAFLPAPLPIHIEYFTASADALGEIQSRADIYGVIGKVQARMAHFGLD